MKLAAMIKNGRTWNTASTSRCETRRIRLWASMHVVSRTTAMRSTANAKSQKPLSRLSETIYEATHLNRSDHRCGNDRTIHQSYYTCLLWNEWLYDRARDSNQRTETTWRSDIVLRRWWCRQGRGETSGKQNQPAQWEVESQYSEHSGRWDVNSLI